MWSVKCEVWGLECEGSSEKWEVWSVKCEVWSVKFEVWSAKSAVCSVRCGVSREGHGRDRLSLNYRSFMFGKLPPPACPGLCYIRGFITMSTGYFMGCDGIWWSFNKGISSGQPMALHGNSRDVWNKSTGGCHHFRIFAIIWVAACSRIPLTCR